MRQYSPVMRDLRLDLRNSNNLLSFDHSDRSLRYIRVIAELPEILLDTLVAGEQLLEQNAAIAKDVERVEGRDKQTRQDA